MTTHNYGLGATSKTLSIPKSSLQEQSTYLEGNKGGSSNTANDSFDIQIKSFDEALVNTGGTHPTVLHMNCEGCEWDMLPELVHTGFITKVDILQVGTHNYGKSLGERALELCQIRRLLSQTHDLEEGEVAFGWERWIKR